MDLAALIGPGCPVHRRANQRMTEHDHAVPNATKPSDSTVCAADSGIRAAGPPATRAPDRRPGRPRPRATGAARQLESASRRVKLSSIRADKGTAAGKPNPPASWVGVNPRGTPAASGFPWVSTTIRSSTAHRAEPARRTPTARGRRDAPRARRAAPGSPPSASPSSRARTRARSSPPTGGEPRTQRARRRAIEPLRVIDHTEERLLLGGLGQQAEGCQSDEEGIRGRAGTEAERDGKRVALRMREAFGELEDRRAQLLKRRVRELHLPFDTDGAGDPELPPRLDRVLQQRGLADARLSVHHQDPAAPAARAPAAGRAPRARAAGRATALPATSPSRPVPTLGSSLLPAA